MKSIMPSFALVILFLLSASDPVQKPRFHQTSIPAGKGPKWIFVADVNHDGIEDILVANADSGTLSVLLGSPNSEFREATGSPFQAGHLPNDIAVADMNRDGNLDVVIPDHQSPYITILLGDGHGGFRPAPGTPIDVKSNPHPHGVAVADFNRDGTPDVVTDSWGANQIELLLGDGRGGLRTPGRFFSVGRRPYERLRTGDFNRDGIPDIVTTNLDDGTVTILLGDGKGDFRNAPGSPFPAGAKPWQVAVDDVDGDGILDLIVIPYQRDLPNQSLNLVTILLGDGQGGFHPKPGPALSLQGCSGPNSVAAGQLERGAKHAIAVGCAQSKNLVIFDPGSNSTFTSSIIPTMGGWGGITIARLASGRGDSLITANESEGTITVFSPN